MNMLSMEIKTVDEAPNYKTGANDGDGFKGAKLIKAVVIRKGMENGKDTVDLQFETEDGQKFVAMTTGTLLKSLASIVNV